MFIIIQIQYFFFCSFYSSHCVEALDHTNDVGKALELLFSKYYKIETIPKKSSNVIDDNDLIEKMSEEKEALASIYSESFSEKIKNKIWKFNLRLDYLVKNDDEKEKKKKPKVQLKDICRLYLAGKCRFGIKCRFLHQQLNPEEKTKPYRDPYFTLEIRFPDGKKFLPIF